MTLTRILMVLLVLVLLSAWAVVATRHQNRLAFMELQDVESKRDELQAEEGRLILEHATWTRERTVADTAHRHLGLQAPSADRIVTMQLSGALPEDHLQTTLAADSRRGMTW